LVSGQLGLSEGSVYERPRRDPALSFDPDIAHAACIYDPQGAIALEKIHREYLDIGRKYGIPMYALTDTWRASGERVRRSRFRDRSVNQDNARFLLGLRSRSYATGVTVFVGGNIGPKGDAYIAAEAPPTEEAVRYHEEQVTALASSGVDFLCASTLPAFPEALGIASLMSRTGLPYALSFVIDSEGRLLDGTLMAEAVQKIDSLAEPAPTCYSVNCVHPRVLSQSLSHLESFPLLLTRFQLFQANTSARRPEELAVLEELEIEEPETLAGLMMEVHRRFPVRFFGGCCGTSADHIETMAKQLAALV
jgi:homocysteine S-methyltransferase